LNHLAAQTAASPQAELAPRCTRAFHAVLGGSPAFVLCTCALASYFMPAGQNWTWLAAL